MNTLITPSVCETALEAIETDAIANALDIMESEYGVQPLSQVPTLEPACEIDAWRVSRGLWQTYDGDGSEQVRTDVKLAVQNASVVNQACANGEEPHPVVMMLAHSDSLVITKDFFDAARRDFEHEMQRITLNAVMAIASVTLAACIAIALDFILSL